MLGRPLHVIALIAERLARQVTERLQHIGHRRIDLSIENPRLQPVASTTLHSDELPHAALSRAAVLSYMAARYGFTISYGAGSTLGQPPSGTEVRITHTLKSALLQGLNDLLAATSTSARAYVGSCWQWHADIRIGNQGAEPIALTLDAIHSERLEQLIAELRHSGNDSTRPNSPSSVSPPPQVTLIARLLEKHITAAQLHALQPGSVLPIAFGRATVLLNDQALLHASIAEHQRKLHLTDFKTLE